MILYLAQSEFYITQNRCKSELNYNNRTLGRYDPRMFAQVFSEHLLALGVTRILPWRRCHGFENKVYLVLQSYSIACTYHITYIPYYIHTTYIILRSYQYITNIPIYYIHTNIFHTYQYITYIPIYYIHTNILHNKYLPYYKGKRHIKARYDKYD